MHDPTARDGLEVPEAAVAQAVMDIRDDYVVEGEVGEYDSTAIWGEPEEVARTVLTAALPHIRRTVIEGLIGKLDTRIDMAILGGDEDEIIATEWQERALDWLRAELEGGGE